MAVNIIILVAVCFAVLVCVCIECAPIDTANAIGVQTMKIESLQGLTSCPFQVVEDENPTRIPRVINRVKCLENCEKCTQNGHSCVQAVNSVRFLYVLWDDEFKSISKVLHAEVKDVEVGCYCADTKAEQAEVYQRKRMAT